MHCRYLIVVFSIIFFSVAVRIRTRCYTAQKIKFSIKDFFSKCDQIRSLGIIHLVRTQNFSKKLAFLTPIRTRTVRIRG